MIIRHVISLLLTRVDTRHPWLGRTGQDSCLDHTLGEVIFPKLYNSKKISSSNIYKFTTHYFIDTSIDMSLTCKVLPTWVIIPLSNEVPTSILQTKNKIIKVINMK